MASVPIPILLQLFSPLLLPAVRRQETATEKFLHTHGGKGRMSLQPKDPSHKQIQAQNSWTLSAVQIRQELPKADLIAAVAVSHGAGLIMSLVAHTLLPELL